jgi:hypothetical protein
MFHTYVASVLSGCYMFAMVFKHFYVFFQVFQKYVSSVSSIFRHMLQVLHLDVSKLDQVLHMGYAWEVGEAASGPRVQPGSAGNIRPAWALRGRAKRKHIGRGVLARGRAWGKHTECRGASTAV